MIQNFNIGMAYPQEIITVRVIGFTPPTTALGQMQRYQTSENEKKNRKEKEGIGGRNDGGEKGGRENEEEGTDRIQPNNSKELFYSLLGKDLR